MWFNTRVLQYFSIRISHDILNSMTHFCSRILKHWFKNGVTLNSCPETLLSNKKFVFQNSLASNAFAYFLFDDLIQNCLWCFRKSHSTSIVNIWWCIWNGTIDSTASSIDRQPFDWKMRHMNSWAWYHASLTRFRSSCVSTCDEKVSINFMSDESTCRAFTLATYKLRKFQFCFWLNSSRHRDACIYHMD